MLLISTTDDWRATHPEAAIGLLEISGVDNAKTSPQLNEHKRDTEARLRERYQGFARKDFLSLPLMSAYARYYKQFNKTYHVQLQLESIVLKEKKLPNISPLVDANFMTEVGTLILTAGHDVAKLKAPVSIDISRVGDRIVQMNGVSKTIRAGDMVMKDAGGISCSIIYGQDNRSPITPESVHVLYVSYAPKGVPVENVEEHLLKIEAAIRLFSPSANVEQHQILTA